MFSRSNISALATALLAALALSTTNLAVAHAPRGFLLGHHQLPVQPQPPVQAVTTVSVKDFGAKGDGTTDDTMSIQNAAASAKSTQKGLFFPTGTYLHNSTLTFNSLAVTGAGGATILLAGDKKNSAVILTGTSPSLQNLVVSTSGLTGSSNGLQPNTATVLVQNATQFTVANDTIVQGQGRFGVYVQKSSVGNVSALYINGTGSANDTGVVIDGCYNVSVLGNIFQNEDTGVSLFPYSGLLTSGYSSQFIAILNNTIGNVTYPTRSSGITDYNSNTLTISQNIVQMANSNKNTYAMFFTSDNTLLVSQNQTYGGYVGLGGLSVGNGANDIVQNFIRNCGSSAISFSTLLSPTTLLAQSNQFGECGFVDTSSNLAVVAISGSKTNVAGVQVINSSYQGHANNLVNYIYAPNVPAANVTGNTQGPNVSTLPSVTGP